jgi:amino acid adenylation domain-containing protein/non-ribosomal peptide synthase protein (TIGR01720 family)
VSGKACIHQLLEARAEGAPEAVALTCEGRQLTYAALDRRANQLAHRLRELGVGPEVLVGLAMERSLEMIVATLAILKAGGAYVPLDPAYPAARLAFMLADARAPVLLTQRHLAPRLPAECAPVVLAVDAEAAELARRPGCNPASGATSDNLAYVIYTSGSTGKPKGVAVTHGNVLRLVDGADYAELTARETFLQLSSISFDVATFEIWGSLANGARLAVFPAVTPSLAELAAFVEREGITTLWLTAGLFCQMADRHLAELRSLRQLLAGGDVLPVPVVRKVLRELPGCRLIDGYGPTENTTFTTCHTVHPDEPLEPSVPIGRPIAGTAAHVLDAALRPLPEGALGELCAAGDGVARGYLHHPESTAERFVPDSFGAPGARLYCTGDLARRRADGVLEFVGRADTQVKIRGFRVEPGEVEAALAAHPAVAQAVVVPRGEGPDGKRLIAYLVAGEAPAPAPKELRAWLAARLPAHMIPSFFVALPALPLTANGKLDRQAIAGFPAPERAGALPIPPTSLTPRTPLTPLETELAAIWSEVLGIPAPGTAEHFFELGGHSLAATQVIARIRDRFGVELPLAAFFAAPTIAGLAERVAAGQRGGAEERELAPPRLLYRIPRGAAPPLSTAQERVWFLQQLDPGNRAYQFQATLRLAGDLDLAALAWSLAEIVRRHESLRTTFPEVDGRPVQRIHPPPALSLPRVDLAALAAADRAAAAARAIAAELARPFDLDRLPLARWTLLTLAPHEHVLLHVEHHLIHDGWSFNVFLGELAALYRAAVADRATMAGIEGRPSPLPEPAIQFADFAQWQRRWLASGQAAAQLAYWKRQLAGCPALLDLPRDRPRPALQRHRGTARRIELPAPLCAALRAFSRRESATLFMTLLAALEILLGRSAGQAEFCVGSGIANRRFRETEGLLGMVINTVALRADLAGDPPCRALLARTRATTLAAYAHQDVPFDAVVEAVQPARDLSYNPLFQVMLGFHDAPLPALDLPGLAVELVEAIANGSAKFDWNLTVIPRAEQRLGRAGAAEGVTVIWEHDTDLFDRATVDRAIGHLETLLGALVAEPETRLADLPLLTAAEEQTLVWFAAGSAPGRSAACLPALFAAQAKRTPEAAAVVAGDEVLTYRELAARAGRLARALRRRDVGPEARVAVCLERTPEMLVALLGILTAGGAYVPLDPAHPRARLSLVLRDAAPVLVLRQGGELEGGAPLGPRSRARAVDPRQLAYVIYTSGSTGQPKGVEIPHGALARALRALGEATEIAAGDRLLAVTTLAFDIAALELFLPLIRGACVVLARREEAADGARLAGLLSRSQATVMQATPATWQLLLAAGWQGTPGLRMLCGGEALPRDLAFELMARGGALYNLYGPTEATIWCTAERIAPEEVVTIGRPIPGMEAHVLDARLRPVPIGVPGDLYLSGSGLARGYREWPDLTAEAFLPYPSTGAPGARLYRTGDRARWLADGRLEFLGRGDDGQVKLRGFRIELGEIEAALRSHPAVADAAVALREDRPGDARLVAYVVAAKECSAELPAHLAERLPDFMRPAAYVRLPALPLNPNGKVDRKALPAPGREPPRAPGAPEDTAMLPRTPLEEALLAIWMKTLGSERIGLDDDFFAAGGHSLLATQLMARVRQTFGVELPLLRLFEARTVARLAEVIARARGSAGVPAGAATGAPLALVPDPERWHEPFPLTDVQEAYWAGRSGDFELGNVATHVYLEIECADLDVARLARAWRQLIARHGMLRAVVLPSGEQQVLPEVPPYEIETLDLRGLDEETAAARATARRAEMSHRVLPSDRWPLFELRATRLDRLDGGRTLLHVGIDSLILDAWSVRILFAELATLYAEPAAVLPALDLSFRDYVLAALGRRESAAYRRSLAYWRERLPDLPPAPELPLARPPERVARPRFTRRTVRLEQDAWQRLKAQALRAGLTPSAVLLAAYAEVLGTWSRSPRFTLNLTLFNRLPLHPQVGALAGDFTSLSLLAVEDAQGGPFAARARRLQEQLWQDLDHREVSGVQVLRELARLAQGQGGRARMPVVFTSTLNLTALGRDGSPWSWLGRLAYSVTQTPQVWLDHQVAEQAGALVLHWDAVDDLFPPGLVDDMLGGYRALLERLASDPAAWEEAERALAPAAQLALRQAVNATAEGGAPVPALLLQTPFLARAAEQPGRPAVVAPGRTLTYGELARQAARLGRLLRQAGARPNTLVAVVMEKGWEPIAAVLGVLAAGAAYLPVDPDLPAERLAHLLRHGEVALALTVTRLDAALAWPEGVRRIALDALPESAAVAGETDDALEPAQGPADLAYVIYTSGSTGQPKGVMIDHRAAVNTLLDINRRFGVGSDDRVLALSALSFDLSVYDLFGLLAAGGTVVVPEPAAARDPARWAALLAAERVTIWNSVPALLGLLVEYLEGRGERLPKALRLALLSGDWIPVTLPDRVRALAPQVQVVSLGGATEAAVWSIVHPIEAVDPTWSSIPYGKPLANQSFHVLDEALRPRPVWVPGDLYISGMGLAQGYWRDAERTGASFVHHPRTGERLYRTGDRGRYLPDGALELLGREDAQVKIQGYRVELGEIEAVLGEHPGVRMAAAAAIPAGNDPRGERRLVACVVPVAGGTSVRELRRHLEERLPAYMQPSALHLVDALPLSANGKVDRRALAALPERAEPAAAPAGGQEITERIAALVARVLSRGRVEPEENLLDRGASSVDMIRIANLVERELGFRPRIDAFHLEPTVAALARGYAEHLARRPVEPTAAGTGADPGPARSFAVLRDPEERAAFKERQPGLRRDIVGLAPGRPAVRLAFEPGNHAGRRTHRSFAPAPVPLRRLGGLLGSLCQTAADGVPRYSYPSAGGLYPVQVYVHAKPGRVEDLPPGLYYHDPVEHRLALLAPDLALDRSLHEPLVNAPIFDQAAFSIFLVARLAAIAPLYGEQARDFCLLEAGAMLQLLMLDAPARELALCPIGRLDFAPIREAFALDEIDESSFLAHSLVGGLPAPAALSRSIPRAARAGDLPLSFAQRRLWFLDRLSPNNPFYNEPASWRLSGRLDAAALGRALDAVVARHEALRTTFAEVDGEPTQAIAPALPVSLARIDLSRLPALPREGEAERLARAEARRPFDLARGPLLRAWLLLLAEGEHQLLLVLHHIVCDNWSVQLVLADLLALYGGAALPDLTIQYADYAAWQRRLGGEETARALAHWRERLAGAPELLALPADRPRPAVQTYRGARHRFRLPGDLAESLAALSRREGATLFMTLLAAFSLLLGRYAGEDDLVVGTPVAGRTRAELEPVVGCFANTLALRLRLSRAPTFRALLAETRATCLAAYAHQEVPFEQLVEALAPPRSLGHAPLVQVLFQLLNAPAAPLALPGLALRPLPIDTGTAKFDLTLFLREEADGLSGLSGNVEYATDLFAAESIARMMGHYAALLRGAVEEPDGELDDLSLLDEQERRQVLREWNRTARAFPDDACLHERIAARAARVPEAVAAVFADASLTHGELAARAGRLARRLRLLGVGPDGLAGVLLERSLDLIVALLAVLEAGGAYLPLDPDSPRERLAGMIADAAPRVLLTSAPLAERLPAGMEMPVLLLDVSGPEPAIAGAPLTRPGARLDDLAYVIYTSGSTGRPKGVMIPHRGVVNRLRWMQEALPLTPADRVLQKTPFTFDVSVWELFWPLLEGATLVLARPGGHREPAYLARAIAAERITVVHFVPSLLEVFLGEPGLAESCAALRQVVCSGEALPPTAAEHCRARLPRAALWNLYGPTEASIDATAWRCAAGEDTVPIGRPIANMQAYVLDGRLRPVPVGLPGELYLGGVGLARGYLDRPELTAESFVPDPFAPAPGTRLYRTGDRARFRADGALDYLGRRDGQVKVRGVRVELGEIETVLREAAGVRAAAVVAQAVGPGDLRLVAYVVGEGAALAPAHLRAALAERLPAALVPAAFVPLPALPLSPNGKLDRRALPPPDWSRHGETPGITAPPRTPAERALARIWAEVLSRERVDADDDFFALGGHSLLAMQVVARVRAALGVELPVSAFFHTPRLAGLAATVAGLPRASAALDALALRPAPEAAVFPASFAQRRLWFLEQWEPGTALYNVPFALRLSGRLDLPALGKSLGEIVRRHAMLRTTFASEDGEPVQVVASQRDLPLAVVDLAALPEAERAARAVLLAGEEAGRPFDLTAGPLVRAALFRLAPEEHLLTLTLHHIAADAWSLGVIARELSALYPAVSARRPSPLPELTFQYADFALWQRQALAAGALAEPEAYWQRHLAGAPAALPLPTDRPRPPLSSGRGATCAIALPPAVSAGLERLCRQHGVTPFMALLAAFQALLSRLAGNEDLVVGTPVAGRARPEFEGLIGCFVNTLALRGDLSGNPTFRELLSRVRAACLAAYAHQDLPFERLLALLQPERRLDRAPVFQVMLALDNVPTAALALPGLAARALPLGTGTAKYDLTLALAQTAEGLRGALEYSTDLFDPPTIARLSAGFTTLLASAIEDPERRLADFALLPPGIASEPAREQPRAAPGDAAPRTPVEEALARIWAAVLRRERVSVHDNFFAAGGDSILSLQVVARAHQAGIRLTPKQLFLHPTIAGLAEIAGSASPAPAAVEEGSATGAVPLTPIQRWFFEQDLPEPQHWNQTFVLEVRRPLSPALVAAALGWIVAHHDAFRLRFARTAEGWQQVYGNAGAPTAVPHLDLSGLAAAAQGPAMARAAAGLQASLDLTEGPLLRAALFALGPRRPGRLLLALHHLIVDGVSWRILLEDLDLACRQLARGEAVLLPPRTTPFGAWARRLAAAARSDEALRELPWWLDQGREETAPLPVDLAGGANLEGAARAVSVALAPAETRALLERAPAAYRTRVNDLLLTALALAGARWTGRRELLVDLEGHGREDLFPDFPDLDLARTVGWFTSVFPVALRLGEARGPGEALAEIKEQLRRVPRQGIGYGLLRYLGAPEIAARLEALPRAEVSFNYLGQLDQTLPEGALFAFARQDAGPSRAPAGRRSHLLEIDAFVLSGRLELRWTYGAGCHRRATIERLAGFYLEALRGLIDHCLAPGAGRLTPADFPLADLARSELDRLLESATGGRPIEDIYPLTPMQEGMLFHTLLAPRSGEYVEQLACTLRGALDLPAFARAWQETVDRHDSLRVDVHADRPGRPLQIVRRRVPVPLPLCDWTALPAADQAAELSRLLAEDRRYGFDPARAPLLRLALCRVGAEAHRFLFSHHHLLLDGWSLALLLKEVFTRYAALSRGAAPPFAPARRYADYVAWWQRQDAAAAEAFWRGALAGFRAPTPLALEAPDPIPTPAAPAGHDERAIQLPAATTAALGALARREQLTLNTLVLGAWALVLARRSGAMDVLFGATVAGRPPALPGVEELVGLCINTLPMRVRVEPEADLLSWLRELQERQAELRQYEHSSLAEVRAWSEMPPGRPLFESLLVFENYPVDVPLRELGGSLAVADVRSIEWTNYPLTLGVGPGPRLALVLTYDRRRFAAGAVERLLDEYRVLLERIAGDPAVRLNALLGRAPAVLPQRTRWKTAATALGILGMHDLVAAQAARTPEAPAVVCSGARLTYAELEARAGRLARALARLGVGPEALVGVALPRSLDLVVAVLGILKAGGAYLPLDLDSPPERLHQVLAESRPAAVVAHRALRPRLPPDLAAPVLAPLALDIDGDLPGTDGPAGGTLAAESLAYVLYTSGSTGAPKGVGVPHRALVHHGAAIAERYGLASSDRVLQFAALSFDVAAEELFPTWLAGACAVLRTEETPLVVPDLLAWLEREGVTVLNLPAPYWHALADALADPETSPALALPAAVRLTVVGSDRVAGERWALWWERAARSDTRLVNAYGLTEATITSTLYEEAPGETLANGGTVPIGRPLAGIEALLLDSFLQPVLEGAAGELCLGGAGLARGYLGRPAETAERFVPHPASRLPGARLYLTGDRARRRFDGALEYLGRADRQVKVRGHRVELGEIEAALALHPAVAAAVAALAEAPPGDRRLVAYVVPRPGKRISPRRLHEHLAARLPEPMVPAVFTLLAALPLTPGGKVDRRALPAPDWNATAGADHDLAGEELDRRDPIAEILAGIWAQVLGLERVGREDDFAELGGHSLLATQIVSRIRDAFQVELPLRDLFDHPTVAALAARVELARRGAQGLQQPLPLRRRPRAGPLPLSFAQERLWFLDQLTPDRPIYNIDVPLALAGQLDVRALRRALAALIDRHEVLRTVFTVVSGRPVQAIAPPCPFLLPLLPIADLAALPAARRAAEARRLATAAARRPFDLGRGPLLRAHLVRLAAEEHHLLLTQHHIVSDGWSAGVTARELAALYAGYRSGAPPLLPDLPIQYADFALWQREWLQGETLARQLAYWRRQLAGAPAVLSLPADRPRPAAHSFAGATREVALTPELSASLAALSRRQGVTLFMALLAGFKALLLRYTGEADLVLASPIAGRTRTETEELIGFFVNTLVLRTDLSGDPPFVDLLRRARAVCLAAYAHQDLPFEKLVEDLAPERTLAHTPLVQVMFQLQSAAPAALQLAGLTLTPLFVDTGTAQFDLAVDLLERPAGLLAQLEYSTDLFDGATIDRLMAAYQTLLAGVVEHPERRLLDLPLLTADERRALLLWSAAPAGRPAVDCLHQLVEAQARRRPDAVAVTDGRAALTYGALDARAARLAGDLRRRGVGPEARVAVRLERSVAQAVAVLAVLKEGGVYLPLDPALPAERLADLLAAAAPHLVLTEEPLRALPSGPAPAARDISPASPASPAHPAYLIYTSGSTGRPKGVLVPHRAAVHHNAAVAQAYGLGPEDRALQFAAPSFDVSIEELFAPWSQGAAVVLLPAGPPAPADLSERLAREGLTVVNLPASYWHEWVRELGELGELGAPPACLRLAVVGSEPIARQRCAEWRRLAPGVRWVGAYGTTETAVTSLLFSPGSPERDGAWDEREELPVGRPIAGTEALVLDRALRPVPAGAVGELYLGGEGLARGYLGEPERTAERFLPHPWSAEPGARLYRTGDLARHRADGNVVFLGRADRQVKLHGYRIELGEIEAALRRHPAVGEAAVVAHEDAPSASGAVFAPGGRRLVAYFVPEITPEYAWAATEAKAEQIEEWRAVHDDEVFNEAAEPADTVGHADPTFHIGGWNSSYTGEPIAAEEMREWVLGTVERILALQPRRPRRILEIGCGTGLLLFRLAPRCAAYWGTDFSPAALDHVRRTLATRAPALPQVTLREREAKDFRGLDGERFDLVILNSVAQYFPSVDDLLEVLAGAVRLLGEGGRVFVGDLRSLPLLRAFHTSVALHRAPAALPLGELEQQVRQRLFEEEELVVDPALFTALRRELPEIGRVEVQLRRGRHGNELTRFRYDAILHVGPPPGDQGSALRLDWPAEGLSLTALSQLLAEKAPERLLLTRIPNARLAREIQTLALLSEMEGAATVGALRSLAERRPAAPAVDPEDLWALGRELGYEVELCPSPEGAGGCCAALFRKPGRASRSLAELIAAGEGAAPRPWSAYANQPLRPKLARHLAGSLAGDLGKLLPAYMVPAAFVALDALPRTPGGKVDRAALPAPEGPGGALQHGTARRTPRDPLELALTQLFEEVLGVHPIGVAESFFALGGHSLLAVRLIALVRKRLGRDLPLAALFQGATVEQLAAALRREPGGRPAALAVALQPRGAGRPFFCIHPAGGGVLHYLDLARHLGTERPFYALHAPGLYGEGEPLPETAGLETLAEEYLAAIRAVQPDGPYALGGWSFGGLVAFELALRLRALGQEVALVALLDAAAPEPAGAVPEEDDAEVIAWYAEDFLRFFGRDLPRERRPRLRGAEELRVLGAEERLRYLHGVATAVHGLPEDTGLDRVRRYLEIYRLNNRAAVRYRPAAVYPGAVALFQAAERAAGEGAEDALGWAPWVGGPLEVHAVPGRHDTFLEEPHVRVVADGLRRCLERALAGEG